MSDASDDHMVETYSSMGLVMTLYDASIAYFCIPHVVDMNALSILLSCVLLLFLCLLYVYVCLRSRVTPNKVRCNPCVVQIVCCIPLGLV